MKQNKISEKNIVWLGRVVHSFYKAERGEFGEKCSLDRKKFVLGEAKINLFHWLIENDGSIPSATRKIASLSGLSYATVSYTISILRKFEYLVPEGKQLRLNY